MAGPAGINLIAAVVAASAALYLLPHALWWARMGLPAWVEGPDDHPGPWPGVVIEWRRDALTGGWAALVVYVVAEANTTTTVQTWLSARFLRPA